MRRVSLLLAVVLVTLAGSVTPAQAQSDSAGVRRLIRELKGRDYDKANGALDQLSELTHSRVEIVAGLIDALRTGEWNRCGGDMRDGIARTLGDWGATKAVPALLQLVKSGKPIEHECSQ
jgi:hypothetical protein